MPVESREKFKLKVVPNRPADADSASVSCPLCDGTGMEYIAGKGVRKCSCRNRDKDEDKMSSSHIPRRYETCSFQSYSPANASQRAAAKLASDFALEFPAVERGLLFTGDAGVGKTHLAVSILKGLIERGFECKFFDFGTLLKKIQDSYNPSTATSELGVLSPVYSSDVLVLDELGATKPTDWVLDTLTHVISTRYNDRKLTIVTTNYPDETNEPRKETLADRIGVRARSRLFEMCRTVPMNGPDYRRKLGGTSL